MRSSSDPCCGHFPQTLFCVRVGQEAETHSSAWQLLPQWPWRGGRQGQGKPVQLLSEGSRKAFFLARNSRHSSIRRFVTLTYTSAKHSTELVVKQETFPFKYSNGIQSFCITHLLCKVSVSLIIGLQRDEETVTNQTSSLSSPKLVGQLFLGPPFSFSHRISVVTYVSETKPKFCFLPTDDPLKMK